MVLVKTTFLCPAPLIASANFSPVTSVDGFFAGCVDVRHHQNVRLIKRAAKIFPEVLRARVAVRLEEDQQALVIAAARGVERGANFGGMMAVVVDQGDAVERAFDFEAPADPGKFREARANQVRRNIQ